MNINGADLVPLREAMLEALTRVERSFNDTNLWMNLSLLMQCLGQRDLGLSIQARALALNRVYHLAASKQPAKLRLLILKAPGDLAANVPLECLFENSEIDLDFYYVSHGTPFPVPIPDHDILMVGIGESDENRILLALLEEPLARWAKPVINAPQDIPTTERTAASRLLRNVSGILISPTVRATRTAMLAIANGNKHISEFFEGYDYPVILRPVGSHAGRNLEKIISSEEITTYLSSVDAEEFFLSPFIDYSGKNGLFRKIRLAMIGGLPFACHLAVSSHWMIHYVNAGMYEDVWKRAEEASFMAHFDDFVQRHQPALKAIYCLTKLDYLCVDCAETQEGQLLVFEIDPAMLVHAMDHEHLFPYKQPQMRKVRNAFQDLLLRLVANHPTANLRW